MRRNWWSIPDHDCTPHAFANHVLDRFTLDHGLSLAPAGRDLLYDLLHDIQADFLADAAQFQAEVDSANAARKQAEEAQAEAEKALEAAQVESARLTADVERLEAALAAADFRVKALEASPTRSLMWREEPPPHPWAKVLKEP